MDTDIQNAATQFDLDKIKAQDYRDALIRQSAERSAYVATVAGFVIWLKDEYSKLPADITPDQARRFDAALSIAAKYFTTGTATDPTAIQADASNDAARFKAALNAMVQAVDNA